MKAALFLVLFQLVAALLVVDAVLALVMPAWLTLSESLVKIAMLG